MTSLKTAAKETKNGYELQKTFTFKFVLKSLNLKTQDSFNRFSDINIISFDLFNPKGEKIHEAKCTEAILPKIDERFGSCFSANSKEHFKC